MNRSALQRGSLLMDWLFAVAIASLFSGIHHSIGNAKLQLSDPLAAICILLALFRGFAAPRVSGITLLLLLIYLVDYLLSALFVKFSTAVIKIAQLALVMSFLSVSFGYYRTRSVDRLLAIVTPLIMLILFINVGWHIGRGQLVGWKDLNEPKTIFILLPLLLILLVDHFQAFRSLPVLIGAASFASIIIFLSGERKAYIFAPLAVLLWVGPRRAWRYFVIPLVALPLLLLGASADKTGYLHRQIGSLQVLLSNSKLDQIPDSQLIDVNRPTTLSNAERVFTNRRAAAEWRKQPLLGIGTNAFEQQMTRDLSIPDEFRLGIHGEFFRALYENGLVGLQLYIAVWIAAFACLAIQWKSHRDPGDVNLNKIKLITLVMFLLYSAFESQKEIMAYVTCAIPYVVGLLPSHRRRAIAAPSYPSYPYLASQTIHDR